MPAADGWPVTPTVRLANAITLKLNEARAGIDAMPDLDSVTITVQFNRLGAGHDRVLLRTESGYLTNGRK